MAEFKNITKDLDFKYNNSNTNKPSNPSIIKNESDNKANPIAKSN